MMKCLHYLDLKWPCGKCIACRLNRQREKKIRLMHEAQQYHGKVVFLTLTYNDENLPLGSTLVKRDLQLFLKRFRRKLEPRQIKFFACGEYGDTTERPHYHMILFNVALDDPVFKNKQYIPSKKAYYVALDEWPLGHCTVAQANDARFAYVAKYCVKKFNANDVDHYHGRLPEFCLTSRGIGLTWALNHAERLKEDNCVTIRGSKVPLPRYYIDKTFDFMEKIDRRLKMKEKMLQEDIENPDLRSRQQKRDDNNARIRRIALKIQNKKGVNNV